MRRWRRLAVRCLAAGRVANCVWVGEQKHLLFGRDLRKGQLLTTHESAHGHYHTKHCHAAVASRARWTNSPAGADDMRQSAACARQL